MEHVIKFCINLRKYLIKDAIMHRYFIHFILIFSYDEDNVKKHSSVKVYKI